MRKMLANNRWIALALFLGALGYWWLAAPRLPDLDQAEEMVRGLLEAESYAFTMEAALTVAGGDSQSWLRVDGEVQGESSRLCGQVLGQWVEVIYCQGRLYQTNDRISWNSAEIATAGEAASYLAELFPAAAFACGPFAACSYVGPLDTDRGGGQLMTFSAPALGWVGEYFTQVEYSLILDKRGRKIQALALSAVTKGGNGARLELQADFSPSQGEEIRPPAM